MIPVRRVRLDREVLESHPLGLVPDPIQEQAKLVASDATAGDKFGGSVAIAGDWALIGAYGDDDNGSASGSAYVFVRSGRIEFYKDEDLFLQTGEQLPVHKDTFVDTEYAADPEAKNKYRLRFVTKNSLYRVHSTHSDNVWLNELQGNKDAESATGIWDSIFASAAA